MQKQIVFYLCHWVIVDETYLPSFLALIPAEGRRWSEGELSSAREALRAYNNVKSACIFRRKYKRFGAGYEARTRYLHLGKVALYQMS